ncbi:hypothetical protein QJS04_geneDACA016637 [Acorus gramineus]|uniref:F-box domain-containing protein n=1 Tax=Acorus gramineus TaxID=55184 RepID=A0AAV9BRM5_ACOGR|nr:hypothetical protein QJS04_geneDACA016637 [Acorus gramineus]
MASCVSKQWQLIMSSDHLWRPIFFSHHHSLSTLHPPNNKPYHHLFSSMHRKPNPPRPSISVSDLIIAVDVFRDNTPMLTVAKPWEDLVEAVGGVFRYMM